MKKLILIPDSFKGTLSSTEICGILSQAAARFFPEAELLSVPVADGGEGSVDAFLSVLGGQRVPVTVTGPLGRPVAAFYGRVGDTAIIEMAAAAGLPLAGDQLDPERATTYGVGQLMAHALQNGATRLLVGLGGSATNDGGTGAAAALGVRFLDAQGQPFVPVGGTLRDIAAIDLSGRLPVLETVRPVVMCDIDNPLCGPTGAAQVFGPQKGADRAMVQRLDDGLRHLAALCARDLGVQILDLPGAGAAGGMGGGMAALLGGRLERGIEAVLDTVDFDRMLDGADLVVTGEGKLDTQSLRGKVVVGVARRAARKQVPVVAIVGDIGDGIDAVYDLGVCGVFSTNRAAIPYAQAKPRAANDLRLTAENLFRFMKRMQGRL